MGGSIKAVAVISGGDNVKGFIQFIQDPAAAAAAAEGGGGGGGGGGGVHVKGRISGPHFNPLNKVHGSPLDAERHAGDLGNIMAGSDGVAHINIADTQIPLSGQHSILGRAVVVHADADDLGKGGHELSKTTGNAGARVGCGIIGLQSSV
ncbi:hypothetical protein ABFX02_10G178500 [Erythranthe guttata]